MKFKTPKLYLLAALALTVSACGSEDVKYVGPLNMPAHQEDGQDWRDSVYSNSMLRKRHRNAPLKVLAIGNSFTINATTYLPWLVERLDGDSICIARLTRSGCSLKQHWESHVNDSPDYVMYYSDAGRWEQENISTIDGAISVMDWDIITIQQTSGHSGLYRTYQPYLDYLAILFHEADPYARLAWHSTWNYRAGCEHSEFKNYDNDPEKMYRAILDATEKAAERMDVIIPSANLIWRMRLEYPEVADGFSEDGYHISDPHALYSLSALWYEVLVGPATGNSSFDLTSLPKDLDATFLERALAIVRELTDTMRPGWRKASGARLSLFS